MDANGEMLPFPSLDNLHYSYAAIAQTRDMTMEIEDLILSMRDGLKLVLDPRTQPLSWALDGTHYLFFRSALVGLGTAPSRAGLGKAGLLTDRKHVLGLQDIHVDMQAGETTVLMGLSGSDKSTLIRHLNRLIEPTTGEILLDGEDVT